MSYLDLAKQALARQLASGRADAGAANAVPPDELNELTKKPGVPECIDVTAALRAAYRRWFVLVVAEADGRAITAAEAQVLHQQIVRLTDEAGLTWADAVYADELRRFRWDTARCGACGGLGHNTPHGAA
jgi:hypothetical protein